MNKAVFLDRDGTLAKDVHYCSRPEDFFLLPTVLEGLKLLNEAGFKLIVITNQSGLARGFFNAEALGQIHARMNTLVAASGSHLSAVYFCPHHPDDKCHCRKPETGMLEQAMREWDIDPARSFFIGDKYLDVEAANRTGCRAVLVPSSEPEIELLNSDTPDSKYKIDFTGADFISAARWICSHSQPST